MAIVLCLGMATSGFANNIFFFDLKKADDIKLLAGEKNLAMLFTSGKTSNVWEIKYREVFSVFIRSCKNDIVTTNLAKKHLLITAGFPQTVKNKIA
ncbi:hypothetical protein [Romboutsia sp.]|uniref:hypothetical protein n=1 Tax=Romboutsia sp. TaxID=1965302 RepID=UPI002CCE5C40|nr:hypothetical protein [Romboutsia sp.]HSQ88265.1 hypothetical protein [Romboutsia sp.]